MVGRLLSPTFNTHLANFRCSLELATMTCMLIWRWRIVTCYQRWDRGNKALTMSSRPPLGTTSKICQKSPPRTMVFPLKIFPIACASSNCIKSHRVQSTASKARRCIIGASSQMIKSALHTNSVAFIYCVMLQIDSSCRSIGIFNGRFYRPKATNMQFLMRQLISTILSCPRRRDKSVVQTNVLLIPPLPYTKNNLPSLFVTTFKIVLYALRWSSLSLSSASSAYVVNECWS